MTTQEGKAISRAYMVPNALRHLGSFDCEIDDNLRSTMPQLHLTWMSRLGVVQEILSATSVSTEGTAVLYDTDTASPDFVKDKDSNLCLKLGSSSFTPDDVVDLKLDLTQAAAIRCRGRDPRMENDSPWASWGRLNNRGVSLLLFVDASPEISRRGGNALRVVRTAIAVDSKLKP